MSPSCWVLPLLIAPSVAFVVSPPAKLLHRPKLLHRQARLRLQASEDDEEFSVDSYAAQKAVQADDSLKNKFSTRAYLSSLSRFADDGRPLLRAPQRCELHPFAQILSRVPLAC